MEGSQFWDLSGYQQNTPGADNMTPEVERLITMFEGSAASREDLPSGFQLDAFQVAQSSSNLSVPSVDQVNDADNFGQDFDFTWINETNSTSDPELDQLWDSIFREQTFRLLSERRSADMTYEETEVEINGLIEAYESDPVGVTAAVEQAILDEGLDPHTFFAEMHEEFNRLEQDSGLSYPAFVPSEEAILQVAARMKTSMSL